MKLVNFGVQLDLPRGWQGHIYHSLSEGNGTVVQASNVPIADPDSDTAATTQAKLALTDMLFTIFEWWPRRLAAGAVSKFESVNLPISIRRGDFGDFESKHAPGYARRMFRIPGQPVDRFFQLGVAFGQREPGNDLVGELNGVLASLQIAPGDYDPSTTD